MTNSEPVARSEGEQVRIRVSVVPVTYVMTMSAARWDSLSYVDRVAVMYDYAEDNRKFEITYEVLPPETKT